MLKSYIKMAVRVLRRNKAFSALNIAGLAVGTAVCLLTFLVIRYERGYDGYQSQKDRIYRVVTDYRNHSNQEIIGRKGGAPRGLADVLRIEFPGIPVAAACGLGPAQITVPSANGGAEEKKFKDPGVFFTEPALFRIFDYTWLAGNAAAIDAPNTAVINESYANAYFGSWKNAMGRMVQLWSFRIPFRIVGVYRDLPDNTDVQVKLGLSYSTLKNISPDDFKYNDRWHVVSDNNQVFVLLPEHMESQVFQVGLTSLVNKYYGEDRAKTPVQSELVAQPLADMHTSEAYTTFKGDALSEKVLWALGLIGAFVLAVACINFINLATAQSVNRAKEVGVRKVLGSNREQLFRQFVLETALITFFALVLGCLLAELAMPFLRGLMQKPIYMGALYAPPILLFLFSIWTAIVVLAGFYPAIVLSGFNPIAAIKSRITAPSMRGVSLRKGLVVFQFVISQLLILGTVVVVRQMDLFRHRPMGFDKETTAFIELPSDSTDRTRYKYLKQELSAVPGVMAASLCMDVPSNLMGQEEYFYFDNNPTKGDFKVAMQMADTDYLSTFHIGLAAGRLPYDHDTAVQEMLINETLLKRLGLHAPADALGRTMALNNPYWKFRIVGVIHDYNSQSLRQAVIPLVLMPNDGAYNFIAVRIEPQRMKGALAEIQKKFTGIYPSFIYDRRFVDESVANFYSTEAITSELVRWCAGLAIFISCLGLYGLVSFMAMQKTKEVGVRKVLGASVGNILVLFSREFTILPIVAFLVAAPLGYYFAHRWLSDFYYHIHLGWDIFVLSLVLSLAIAWMTVGYKALRAALANPVKSLRTE